MNRRVTAPRPAICLGDAAPALASPVTPIAELWRGTAVTIAGMVERIAEEDEFILRDATGSVLVHIGPNRIPAAPGDRMTVTGIVDDDPDLEVCADAIFRADGTRIELPRRY